jgi:hypothetical protein
LREELPSAGIGPLREELPGRRSCLLKLQPYKEASALIKEDLP